MLWPAHAHRHSKKHLAIGFMRLSCHRRPQLVALANILCSLTLPCRTYTSTLSSSAARGKRARMEGNHGNSRASARQESFQSPLMFDEAVRAHEQRAKKQQPQQGVRTEGMPAFSSTYHHRIWASDLAETAGGTAAAGSTGPSSPPSTARTRSTRGNSNHDGDSHYRSDNARQKSSVGTHHSHNSSLVLPYSAFAYRSRLTHARMSTLLELVDAPYAPSPLRVLLDVMAEMRRLHSLLSPHSGATAASRAALSSHIHGDEPMRVHGSSAENERKAVAAVADALKRLTAVLSRAQDVRRILKRVCHATTEVVATADVVGDRDSMTELQTMMELFQCFADEVLPRPREQTTPDNSNDINSDTTLSASPSPSAEGSNFGEESREAFLPDATYAEMLHGVIEMSEALGSPLTAVTALDALIAVSQASAAAAAAIAAASSHKRSNRSKHSPIAIRQESETAIGNGNETNERNDDDDDDETNEDADGEFSVDDVISLVDKEMQSTLRPVTAEDHLRTIGSCKRTHNFDLALTLYRRFMHHAELGVFSVSPDDASAVLTALAGCSGTSVDFSELQRLLIGSEAAQLVPVSVPLYTALIDAVSRAVDLPHRMSVALALYRRLRDCQLTPTVDTYAALIACCASTREPTHAFAFYQEARLVCGVDAFTPRLYTNFLLAYVNGGFGADARRTLDVLVEAGAPLTRSAFHAVLSGAATLREAREVLEMMTQQYHIAPTPHTFAFLVHAAARQRQGVATALTIVDLHEDAICSLLEMSSSSAVRADGGEGSDYTSSATSHEATVSAVTIASRTGALDATLIKQFPLYVRSVEHVLMQLRVDPSMDPRMAAYLRPLLRVAQQRMNAFTEMPPQAPTRIPAGEAACIAVLAADVLANVEEWVLPFVSYYSAIVIPYSALLALQGGGGRRVDGLTAKGSSAGLHDEVWATAGDERSAVVEHRRRRLVKFLSTYRDVVHLVSLEEELRWSRDTTRYGVPVTDWMARSAAFAMNLARNDVPGGTKLYANHAEAAIVLVSADYRNCGRYIVDLKKVYGAANRGAAGGPSGQQSPYDGHGGLREGLAKVFYHNPQTRPTWSPLALSMHRGKYVGKESEISGGGGDMPTEEQEQQPPVLSRGAEGASEDQMGSSAAATTVAGGGVTANDGDVALDTELLMSIMHD